MAKAKEYFYAVGRRKLSTAVIKLYPNGTGKFNVKLSSDKVVNLKDYFGGNIQFYNNSLMSFDILGKDFRRQFDADIVIKGGGMSGQSDSIKLGFARTLILWDVNVRTTLKPYGLLKRDPRIKERKKPGLKKARKGPTWSKR